MTQKNPLSKIQLNSVVLDKSGQTHQLGEFLSTPTFLIFVRHFGCIGCSSIMTELSPRLHEFQQKEISVVLVGNGKPAYIEGFLERFNLKNKKITILTDPSLKIHEKFKLKRSLWGAIGPAALQHTLKWFAKGLVQTSIEGSNSQQGGAFLIDGEKNIIFSHFNEHMGDNVDLSLLMEMATKLYLSKKGLVEGEV